MARNVHKLSLGAHMENCPQPLYYFRVQP